MLLPGAGRYPRKEAGGGDTSNELDPVTVSSANRTIQARGLERSPDASVPSVSLGSISASPRGRKGLHTSTVGSKQGTNLIRLASRQRPALHPISWTVKLRQNQKGICQEQ